MGEIEKAITDGVVNAMDVDEVAPTPTGFVPLHATGKVGDMNSNSSTQPWDTGMNAGTATRPMAPGYIGITDNPDHARHVAEAKAAHAVADASLRRFRNAPIVSPGTVPGLTAPVKGQNNE